MPALQVEYTASPHLPIMYACGTTPANATLVGQLLTIETIACTIARQLLDSKHTVHSDSANTPASDSVLDVLYGVYCVL